MWQRAMRQQSLFDNDEGLHVPQLREELQEEVRRLLVQWLVALAKAIDGEAVDE